MTHAEAQHSALSFGKSDADIAKYFVDKAIYTLGACGNLSHAQIASLYEETQQALQLLQVRIAQALPTEQSKCFHL